MDSFTSLDVSYLFYQVYQLVIGADVSFVSAPAYLSEFWARFTVVSYLVSGVLLVGVIYALVRIQRIRAEEYRELYPAAAPGAVGAPAEMPKNDKWEHIKELAYSEEPRDWRLAILEADIILDEMVTRMGYQGDTLGEKLRSIEPSDFMTLNEAWEAHKVRNAIAHEGSDFILTARETRRVIELYKAVFREFHYI